MGLKDLKITIENDWRREFQAELKRLREENFRLSSRIQTLEEGMYKSINICSDMNCTKVKECVAEDLDEINSKLIADEMRIDQVQIDCVFFISMMPNIKLSMIILYFYVL